MKEVGLLRGGGGGWKKGLKIDRWREKWTGECWGGGGVDCGRGSPRRQGQVFEIKKPPSHQEMVSSKQSCRFAHLKIRKTLRKLFSHVRNSGFYLFFAFLRTKS